MLETVGLWAGRQPRRHVHQWRRGGCILRRIVPARSRTTAVRSTRRCRGWLGGFSRGGRDWRIIIASVRINSSDPSFWGDAGSRPHRSTARDAGSSGLPNGIFRVQPYDAFGAKEARGIVRHFWGSRMAVHGATSLSASKPTPISSTLCFISSPTGKPATSSCLTRPYPPT